MEKEDEKIFVGRGHMAWGYTEKYFWKIQMKITVRYHLTPLKNRT